MKTKIKWRLSKLPTPEELRGLVKDKIITQEEAKTILLESQNKEDQDIESLNAEIKFLRELVDKLSDKQTISTIIYEKIPQYQRWGWTNPYINWCTTGSVTSTLGNVTTHNANFSDLNVLN